MSIEGNETPLITERSSVSMEPQTRNQNKVLKVVGVTLLAGILIAGQAFTAYMAYSHKEQLSTLERRGDRLHEISRKSAMRAPLKMHLPMSSLALTYEDETKENKNSPSSTPKPEPKVLTQCQKEAAGEVKSLLPSFRPRCDVNGDYIVHQCWEKTDVCWCVDKNGIEIEDTLTNGPAPCWNADSDATVVKEPLLGKNGE